MNKITVALLIFLLLISTLVSCNSNNSGADNDIVHDILSRPSSSSDASAQDFYFEKLDDGNYAVLINSTSTATSLTLPTTHEGKSVTEFNGIIYSSENNYSPPKNLKSLTIHKGIKTISGTGNGLSSCDDINIYITDLLSWCQIEMESDTTIPYGTNLYINNKQLKEQLIIPEGVTIIKEGTFNFLENIASVTLPSTVNTIEDNAFYRYQETQKIYEVINHSSLAIKAGYQNHGGIAENAIFVHNDQISRLEFLNGFVLNENTLIGYVGQSSDLTFPERSAGSYNIDDYAFENRDDITSVKFSNSVLKIGSHAFDDCDKLESVTISSSVVEIGSYAFSGCISLKKAYFMDTEGWHYTTSDPWYIDGLITALDDEVGAAVKLWWVRPNGFLNVTWEKE